MSPYRSDPEFGRLRWRCRRGMRELDRLLGGYLERHYGGASPAEQRLFRELLELQDPVLYAYVLGQEQPSNAEQVALIARIVRPGPAH